MINFRSDLPGAGNMPAATATHSLADHVSNLKPHTMNSNGQATPQSLQARSNPSRESILADFRATFTSPQGRRVLAILDASVRYGKPAFLPSAGSGPYDPIAAAISDGRKSVLAEIHDHLDTAEDGGDPGPKAIV